ncbi:MAG: hypothetical protein HY537_16735 [Deltaproteobacteria bacterium]|nr:hypothetical protein [Deltaproteobacteria bacterium]
MKDSQKDRSEEMKGSRREVSLHERALKSRSTPRYPSKEDALLGMRNELAALAKKCGLSVEQLLVEAEHSHVFREEFVEALVLARRIAHFET